MKPENIHEYFEKKRRYGRLVGASLLIIAGLVVLGYNLGWVPPLAYRIIISWQMLLIVFGLMHLFAHRTFHGGRHLKGSISFILLGMFFLVPVITGAGKAWLATWWPLLIVAFGVVMLISHKGGRGRHRRFDHRRFGHRHGPIHETSSTDNGFVDSSVTFGSVKHIVMDPVFRGARISNTFGSTILDLRHTSLGEGDTPIEIDCTFGGIELLIPEMWSVKSEVDSMIGAVDDKRRTTVMEPSGDSRLLMRGKITFGGIEIRS